jgi:5-methylcytosine-specific restriction protein B
VLDRAFTLEFNEVNFTDYGKPLEAGAAALTSAERQQLLSDFRGSDSRDAKTLISEYLQDREDVRDALQDLNEQLQPHNMHFGYRVFDEIVLFLARARQNGLLAAEGAQSEAFDLAVLMKVLPKFHGSRARLEKPLQAVLDWCRHGDPAVDRYPHTAKRVRRMQQQLNTDGFAAFG